MQKLLSLFMGVAVTLSFSAPRQASAQLWNVGSITQHKTLKATIHLDHKLSRVHGSEGALTAIIHGGIKPYQYQWSNGSTASFINGLEAGTYSLTVIDGR